MIIMTKQRNSCFVKLIVCVLLVALITPIDANAAVPETVSPQASLYLTAYTAYICAMGDGDLEIWYRVTGTDIWADIGVLIIFLYESTDNKNWYWVDTFQHMDYEEMLAHNTWQHMSHVDYEGIAGRYYKAYVGIWAGPEDGGDARYIWTDVERAT